MLSEGGQGVYSQKRDSFAFKSLLFQAAAQAIDVVLCKVCAQGSRDGGGAP